MLVLPLHYINLSMEHVSVPSDTGDIRHVIKDYVKQNFNKTMLI